MLLIFTAIILRDSAKAYNSPAQVLPNVSMFRNQLKKKKHLQQDWVLSVVVYAGIPYGD